MFPEIFVNTHSSLCIIAQRVFVFQKANVKDMLFLRKQARAKRKRLCPGETGSGEIGICRCEALARKRLKSLPLEGKVARSAG